MRLRDIGFSAALGIALVAPAHAIIMRDDVDDRLYRDLGYAHVEVLAQMGLRSERSAWGPMLYNGMGTLIAPDWVVTAAHVTQHIADNPPPDGSPHFVFIKGRGYAVAEIVQHPDYDPQTQANDIALVRLSEPVRDPHPACLYERRDEAGQVVTLIGAGYRGDGRTGPLEGADGALRGAQIRVGSAEPTILTWQFHAPGESEAMPLEGISGPGDSGGPALIETQRGYCIAGVSSAQRVVVQIDESGRETGGEGRYGAVEVYTRVSSFLPWISTVMARSQPG